MLSLNEFEEGGSLNNMDLDKAFFLIYVLIVSLNS